MVRPLGEEMEDPSPPSRVQGGVGHDFLEKLPGDVLGAGEGEEDPSRFQQLKGEKVDVLVPPGRPFHLSLRLGELGRVEDDGAERPLPVPEFPKHVKDVSPDRFHGGPAETVHVPVASGQFEGGKGTVHVGHRRRTAREGPHGKPPGVGKGVQDGAVLHEVPECPSVFPLIEIKARFLSFLDVGQEPAGAFHERNGAGGAFSPEGALSFGQAFPEPGVRVGSFVYSITWHNIHEAIDKCVPEEFGPRGAELAD